MHRHHQPSTCLPGWADCDGNVMNGCEENLSISTNACGACGNACGSGWCNNGTCRASACSNGVRWQRVRHRLRRLLRRCAACSPAVATDCSTGMC
ncbi:MAG: hypothetical protein IPF99_35510 [Deltaproteobacteria bacterium]|nr:hypothetical protein [Deltaproteobacteria bacterium]